MKHDNVLPLNYCAHAIEDLRATAISLRQVMPETAHVLYRLITMLQNSVKFILPNCCNLVEPDEIRQAHFDLLRLPFPCVAFEAPWEKDEEGPEYLGDFKQSPMTKRITLCWDGRQFEPLPGLNQFFDCVEDGGAFVLPLYWGPEFKKWSVSFGGAFVPYGAVLGHGPLNDVPPATRIARAALLGSGQAHAGSNEFRAEPFPILPELYECTVAQYGSHDKAIAQIILDTNDDVMVLIQACSVINCANVKTADLAPQAKLNKRRLASGKQPFFSYKVLELSDEGKGTNQGAGGGHHSSPRMHLRRGHLRQLERKVVWVRPAMINAGSPRGVVEKDYSVANVPGSKIVGAFPTLRE